MASAVRMQFKGGSPVTWPHLLECSCPRMKQDMTSSLPLLESYDFNIKDAMVM